MTLIVITFAVILMVPVVGAAFKITVPGVLNGKVFVKALVFEVAAVDSFTRLFVAAKVFRLAVAFIFFVPVWAILNTHLI